eukprot:Tbor_TRINITY_DN5108_c0_g1::TRINITY_DN5108_c0_g1_i1::g.26237::m.26237/K00021/HMGCR; hydroxymethylglutaryl-CoA reductase (NADPH)
MRRTIFLSTRKWSALSNAELVKAVMDKEIPFYGIEAALNLDFERAIGIRRSVVKSYVKHRPDSAELKAALNEIPYKDYDWSKVMGQNCENVIGYVPIPIGLAGPIIIDGIEVPLPMATTEGALVASTHRGARAINQSGGCTAIVLSEGMTRAPLVSLDSLSEVARLKEFCVDEFENIKKAFESTTRFGKLISLKLAVAGRKVHLRFRAHTGDAMGMNMVTKGVEQSLRLIKDSFPSMTLLSLSGNYCADKKPSAINWIEGRGKSVVAEAIVKREIVEKVLKTRVEDLVQLNIDKNYIGSAMAGSLGGFNAQSANVVAAMFLATGQDPAQVIASSNCLTSMSSLKGDLLISVTMPSIEVGTVGGGTGLPSQRACLELTGCSGANKADPGSNSRHLSRVIAAGVLSAELSLMSGLAAGHLLDAHLKLNRKPQ